jgi:hypothetical protein
MKEDAVSTGTFFQKVLRIHKVLFSLEESKSSHSNRIALGFGKVIKMAAPMFGLNYVVE